MIANHPRYGGDWLSYKETLVPHLVAALIYLSQNYSYYIINHMITVRNTLILSVGWH